MRLFPEEYRDSTQSFNCNFGLRKFVYRCLLDETFSNHIRNLRMTFTAPVNMMFVTDRPVQCVVYGHTYCVIQYDCARGDPKEN